MSGDPVPRFLLPLLLLAACTPDGGKGSDKPPAEICDNLEDDDLDELADCADPDCAAVCGEVCTNGTDDDLDGLIDCLDDDCDGLCPENCGDGRDNDADGAIDCDDRDCFGSCPEVCGDGFDNDGDGKVDCLDEECVDPSCLEICTDGRDNDADALIDCADDDCNDPVCDEACADGRDNDADGRVDCDDSDCDGDCPEICTDGRDNDADGQVDCDDDECAAECDADGDGFFNADYGGDDCDDTRADVNPSRPEICNGDEVLDDDCNGLFDEDDPDVDVFTLIAWGPDEDGDGYGTDRDIQFACQQPDGWGFANQDCDDTRADVNPDMPEICNPDEPLDDDCDGRVDDADPDVTEDSYLEWYADRDGDGFGAEDDFVYACSRPDGTAATNDDCDDADPTVGPPSLWFPDADGDGFAPEGIDPADPVPSCDPPGPGLRPLWVGVDCLPDDPGAYPDAEEICEDGIDQDCDGRDRSCMMMYAADGSYGVTGLWQIDMDAGTAVLAFDPGIPITGMTFDDRDQLYVIEAANGYGSGEVYRVDLDAEILIPIATTRQNETSLSWKDGLLYAADENSQYASIDPATGAVSVLAGTPDGGGYGFAHAWDGATMWRMSGSELRELDASGTDRFITAVSGVGGLYGYAQGGGLTVIDGELLFAGDDGRGGTAIYSVDPVTGVATATGVVIPSDTIDALGGTPY
ncbi:MAG: hypothetical protein ACI8PZ_005137 [Myxococcota bacterium]|jgi:hypothetical protein